MQWPRRPPSPPPLLGNRRALRTERGGAGSTGRRGSWHGVPGYPHEACSDSVNCSRLKRQLILGFESVRNNHYDSPAAIARSGEIK